MKDTITDQTSPDSATRRISRFDVQTVISDGAAVRSLTSPFSGLEKYDDHLTEDNGHKVSSRVKTLRIQESDFTHPDLNLKRLASSSRKPYYNGNTISSMQSVGQMSQLSSSLPKVNLDSNEEITTLVITGLERLPQKDFASEVRAILDIGTFIKEATFMLDLDGTDLDDILNTILDAVFANSSKPHNVIASGSNTASPNTNNVPEVDGSRASPLISTTHSVEPRNALGQIASYARQNNSKLDLEKLVAEAKKSLLFEVQFQDHKYQRLAKTIKGVSMLDDECLSTDQTWVCAMCSLNSIHKRYLALARLANPVNLGRSSEEIRLIVLVITPTKEKETKSDIEVGRTIATILLDPEFRASIMYAGDDAEVKSLFWSRAKQLSLLQTSQVRRLSNMPQHLQMDEEMVRI
ncbi:solute carrier family 4 (sodium borate transporter), member 11 [Paragonimus westermani]|uniref:Solute carrier family 4 (Sodium borate transporter), member 11 n=1 Tax=Paragonimus westermani TaxID=34504 RepID=A0A5J4NWQ2_9TREM|nr:solute carrier family 4 (sodium borate transporter), member 11 [Paragonimus westermani]